MSAERRLSAGSTRRAVAVAAGNEQLRGAGRSDAGVDEQSGGDLAEAVEESAIDLDQLVAQWLG